MAAAIFGLLGVLVGSTIQAIAGELRYKRDTAVDRARVDLLKKMLKHGDYRWRSLGMCAQVIGADEETTIRLLIQAGARGNEKCGSDKWGLISRNPLSAIEDPDARI